MLAKSSSTTLFNSDIKNKIGKYDTVEATNIEIYGETPYIDFHNKKTTDDYTSRIFEALPGCLEVEGVRGRALSMRNYKGNMSNLCTGSNMIHFQWNSGHLEVWIDTTHVGNINF